MPTYPRCPPHGLTAIEREAELAALRRLHQTLRDLSVTICVETRVQVSTPRVAICCSPVWLPSHALASLCAARIAGLEAEALSAAPPPSPVPGEGRDGGPATQEAFSPGLPAEAVAKAGDPPLVQPLDSQAEWCCWTAAVEEFLMLPCFHTICRAADAYTAWAQAYMPDAEPLSRAALVQNTIDKLTTLAAMGHPDVH